MRRSRRKIDYHEHDTPSAREIPEGAGVASANECTGLMYRTPQGEGELEAYRELSPLEAPQEAPAARAGRGARPAGGTGKKER